VELNSYKCLANDDTVSVHLAIIMATSLERVYDHYITEVKHLLNIEDEDFLKNVSQCFSMILKK